MLSKVLTIIAITYSLVGCITPKSEKTNNINQPPSFQTVEDQLLKVGEQLRIELNALDPEGGQLSYSINNMPTWLSLDSSTGSLYGTPTLQDTGFYDGITVEISDGDNLISVGPFFIQVEEELYDIILNWTAVTEDINDDTANIAGYKIYLEKFDDRFSSSVIIVNNGAETSHIIRRLAPSTYTFKMTSYLSSGLESDESIERQFIL